MTKIVVTDSEGGEGGSETKVQTPLYNTAILRLATNIPHLDRLPNPQGTAERRSPICGSRVTVDVILGGDGRVAAMGQDVRACALGQASASLMGAHAIGRSLDDFKSARDMLSAFLACARNDPGDWPGLDAFAEARQHNARHASILLPFDAIVDAVKQAVG
jgi:NifU-like protein involved in Fe-S cluster formation